MATAEITEEKAQYLFANYNNISETDAENFVAYVFGTGDRTITGDLDVTGDTILEGDASVGGTLFTNSLEQRTGAGLIIASATDKKLGFWGQAPVVQQILATGAGNDADDVITALQAIGLFKQA